MKNNTLYKPKIFNLKIKKDLVLFEKFKKNNPELNYIDTLGEQKHELSLVRNPRLISHQSLNPSQTKPVSNKEGVWVYFPWKNTVVRILAKKEYEKLRLARNQNLITKKEQKKLSLSKIGVVGLNVGNPGAVCIALEGISNKIKLSDLDPLSVSNLNRFHAGLAEVGINKAHITARQIYEVNPYADLELYDNGISKNNISNFLNKQKIDLLVEEMDNLKLKIAIREKAKKYKIPVIMVTGNGENVLIDVERYDIKKDLPLLSGYLSDDVIKNILKTKQGEGKYVDRINLARDFMGIEYLDNRLVDSFAGVGKTLAGIPQLAESSFLRGAVIAHFAKKILLKEKVSSGRYTILLSGEIYKNDKKNKTNKK